MREALQAKYVGETISVSFDFSSSIGIGETISSASVAAAVWSGTDASPGSIIAGGSSISQAVVSQRVSAGIAGVIYLLTCTATTSASQVLQIESYLPVVPA